MPSEARAARTIQPSAGVPFSEISENVAEAPSVVQIHDMWMHSEHHRENLLDPNIDSAGISVVVRGRELYAVGSHTNSAGCQACG